MIAVSALGPAAARAEPVPTEVKWSLGGDLDAWRFGMGGSAGLWIRRGYLLAGIHLHAGILRLQYDPAASDSYNAFTGAYGAQLGAMLGHDVFSPYFLAGYDRMASAASTADLGQGGGRTQQEINLEAGLEVWSNSRSEGLLGVRWSYGFDQSSTAPAGPQFPKAALTLTALLGF